MLFGIITVLIIAVDLWTKNLFTNIAWPWFGCIGLFHHQNPGIAFSLPLSGWPQIIITIILLIGGGWWASRHFNWQKHTTHLALGLIAGGGLGNLYERITIGAVTDFMKVCSFPTFNVADSAIFIGVVWLLIRYNHLLKPTPAPFADQPRSNG